MFDSARLAEFRSAGFVCSAEHAEHALGFTAAIPLPIGLEQTVRWYRNEGWV
jgi:nucleoside-diphosphate-sugar epimerase